MSHYRDVVARMAVDAEFARHVRANPEEVARQFGLTPDETQKLRGLADAQAGAGPELLGARLSKSGLGSGAVIGALGDVGSLVPSLDPDPPVVLQFDPPIVLEFDPIPVPEPATPPTVEIDPDLLENLPPLLDLPPFVLDPDLLTPPGPGTDPEAPTPEPPAPAAPPAAPPVVNVDVQLPPTEVAPDAAAPSEPVFGQTTEPVPAAAPDSGDGSGGLAIGVAGAAGAVAGVAAAAAAAAAAKAARERRQEG